MSESGGDAVVESYSTYLRSFERNVKLQRTVGRSHEALVGDLLRSFKLVGQPVVPVMDLQLKSGLGILNFADALREATESGLVEVESDGGDEKVKLLPIGEAALKAQH